MDTYGLRPATTARVLCNKIAYAFVRSVKKTPEEGWLHSPWHWYRSPFSLRREILWSSPLQAWFCPEDESAMECMLHLPTYEPVGWVSPKPGDIFLDIGAYIGWYSIRAAKAVGPSGRVVALEPDPANRRQLEKNLSLNGLANCTVVPMAAWSGTGKIGWESNDVPVWRKVDQAQTTAFVRAVTVDSLVDDLDLPDVRWVKMDIEGAEIEALQGAEGVLRRCHPALFIEVHETLGPVSRFLEKFGYSIEQAAYDQPPDRHGWILAR